MNLDSVSVFQHCAMIWGGHSYYWADYTCSEDTSSGGQYYPITGCYSQVAIIHYQVT